ncbi:hybrid sensor histidine kinase/response regulator [Crocosphaera sp.]|uniref:hybrid sensor histidine kinase/response regulator n=1 Tax=Crocosphaera sp. TaxID=2729996 RepID=UPI0026320335|nr:hybrid sensor histidine kinase/response regulator [Crocosphaera sp.]MDJ0579565.1 hybrid sensor histidine kinase/response regulator [Crocosphaera sp.]
MMNPDIRDQAYQFFIEEAPELLYIIETGLLTLKEERDTSTIHEIMRAAHSIKGGAASVELDTIKIIAHRLEDIFKALYDETVIIDDELENLLLEGFDHLRDPLEDQIITGSFDEEGAIDTALPIFEAIEAILGDSMAQGEQYLPSSADLGIDIVSSLFEVDVAQGLQEIETALASGDNEQITQTLRTQGEVFSGFSEILGLPGFGKIVQNMVQALEQLPSEALSIAQVALGDLKQSQHLVLVEGDRTSGGQPSEALLSLAQGNILETPMSAPVVEIPSEPSVNKNSVFSLDNLFSEKDEEAAQSLLSSDDAVVDRVEVEQETPVKSLEFSDSPPLDDIFGSTIAEKEEPDWEGVPALDDVFGEPVGELSEPVEEVPFAASLDNLFGKVETPKEETLSLEVEVNETKIQENIDTFIESVENIFETLPTVEEQSNPSITGKPVSRETFRHSSDTTRSNRPTRSSGATRSSKATKGQRRSSQTERSSKEKKAGLLSVRVDFNRLEKMNNLVGELVINRNSLSLQNEQLQNKVKDLVERFSYFQKITENLKKLSDQMVVRPERYGKKKGLENSGNGENTVDFSSLYTLSEATDFDSLEMDSYGTVYSIVQNLLEEMMQLEESVDDIVLFARSSNQTLEEQRQMLNSLRDELMWARMLPLGEVLNRFPRVLRDLSNQYHKPVKLELTGSSVLVDKAALEKLYDPLQHLLRNGFDHGIEPPEIRRKLGKPEQGKIEIVAYHQGNQTIIEMHDDGGGLDLDKIAKKAVQAGLVTPEQVALMTKEALENLIFEPGFSTANKVSELSGRGVGLDVVREQLTALKGKVSVSSLAGQGTTFTLRLPLTLTIAKLLVCLIHYDNYHQGSAIALPSDSIEEIIMPEPEQIKVSGEQRFLAWQGKIIPIYAMQHLLEYRSSSIDGFVSQSLQGISTPDHWGLPLLILRRGEHLHALEVTRLLTEQELVIKPFGKAIAAPAYTYGCTILGDGTLIPVVNGTILLEEHLDSYQSSGKAAGIRVESSDNQGSTPITISQNPTVLVVDDSAALRRTLALTLQKSGYRVLQAKDGREALEQLQQTSGINLVICDVEMPNMNGFEFLGKRRRDPQMMKIPVAMLTSRSSEKHRQLATHLGASAYFTKPYVEQQFLETVKNMINN